MKTLLALLLLIPSISFGLSKEELKEELKYWKTLLDDGLISQEDYQQKKEELLSIPPQSNKSENKFNTNELINNIKNIFDSGEKNKDEETPKDSNKYVTQYKDFPLYEDDVLKIQKAFLSMGYDINVDGIYGNETKGILDYWMNCSNYSKFNAQTYDNLNKGLGCNLKKNKNIIAKGDEKQNNNSTKYVYCNKKGLSSYSAADVTAREENCLGNEVLIKEPYWCNYSSVNDPKLLAACPNRKTMTVTVDTSKGQKNTESYKVSNGSKSTTTGSYNIKNNNNFKTSSSNNKCSGLKSEKNILYKGVTGFWSEKDACMKIMNSTDTRLCMWLKFEEDKQYVKTDKMINMYKEEAYKRNITCIDGTAFKSDNSNTQSILSQKKLEDKMEKKMACTARRTEWSALCKTGDYRIVNGVHCYARWNDRLHC